MFPFMLCVTVALVAQSKNGKVVGIVRDPSKAAIPGVQVTLTNIETNAVLKIVSNESGEYRFDAPAGRYEIKADLPGFRSVKIANLRIDESSTMQMAPLEMTIGPA